MILEWDRRKRLFQTIKDTDETSFSFRWFDFLSLDVDTHTYTFIRFRNYSDQIHLRMIINTSPNWNNHYWCLMIIEEVDLKNSSDCSFSGYICLLWRSIVSIWIIMFKQNKWSRLEKNKNNNNIINKKEGMSRIDDDDGSVAVLPQAFSNY